MGPRSGFLLLSLGKQGWQNPSSKVLVDRDHGREGDAAQDRAVAVERQLQGLVLKGHGVNKSGGLMASCRTRWRASKCAL